MSLTASLEGNTSCLKTSFEEEECTLGSLVHAWVGSGWVCAVCQWGLSRMRFDLFMFFLKTLRNEPYHLSAFSGRVQRVWLQYASEASEIQSASEGPLLWGWTLCLPNTAQGKLPASSASRSTSLLGAENTGNYWMLMDGAVSLLLSIF